MDISNNLGATRQPLSFWISDTVQMRLLQQADAAELFALVNRNRSYLRQWLPWLDLNTSVLDSEIFIRSLAEQHQQKLGFSCGIYNDGRLIGICGFHERDLQRSSIYIGYWLDQAYQGRGIISRCVRALVNYGFDKLALDTIYIAVAEHNLKSRAIPERLGFSFDVIQAKAEFLYDHFVDHVRYSKHRDQNG